jgi:hypothetical protein
MRKTWLLGLLLILGLCSGLLAQTLEYAFSATQGTYTPITGGILLGTDSSDDQRFVDPAVPEGGTTTTGPGFDIGMLSPSTARFSSAWPSTTMADFAVIQR